MAGSGTARATGISVWLVPEGDARETLAALIADLSRRHGTPSFEPHVTILGGVGGGEGEVLRRGALLAASLRPLTIRLAALGRSDEYFRCLFLEAEASPDLLAAHERASDWLGARDGAAFLPHLSLLYGRLSAQDAPEALGSVALPLAFEVRRLEMHRTEGAVPEWRRLAVHPLSL
jgi:2'-5' RNA ligase